MVDPVDRRPSRSSDQARLEMLFFGGWRLSRYLEVGRKELNANERRLLESSSPVALTNVSSVMVISCGVFPGDRIKIIVSKGGDGHTPTASRRETSGTEGALAATHAYLTTPTTPLPEGGHWSFQPDARIRTGVFARESQEDLEA